MRVFEDVVSPALISACAFLVHVPVHLADVLRPPWANTLKGKICSVAFGAADVRRFPCEHKVYDVLVVVDGPECPPELEGQKVDYVWDTGFV